MSRTIDFETDFLVVGSGPTGATAALALATYGVRTHLVSKWNWLANSPRAHITNQRAVEVLRDLDADNPVESGLRLLADTGPEGVRRRAALAEALALKNTEFNAQGTEMNHRCESAAVWAEADAGDEVWQRDRQLYLQPTTRPGAKLPHAWQIDRSGHKLSTLDLVGKGLFTLLTGLSGQVWLEAAHALNEPALRTRVVGEPGAMDAYFTWAGLREIDEDGALLVRPDGVIAWRAHQAPAQAASARAQLEAALRKVLSR